jgi:hypothetical protein
MRGPSVSYIPGRGADVTITWMGKEYTDQLTYYREVILTMPEEDGVLLGAQTHLDALSALGHGGLFVIERDDTDIYVDDWMVSNPFFLTHKHPEFGELTNYGWAKGTVEADVHHSKCELCAKRIPGEIEMMHHFYRLDG